MKTEYRHIEFKQDAKGIWHCGNPKQDCYLGFAEFVPRWKCFQFAPEPNTAFTQDCLADLAHFVGQLDQEYKSSLMPKRQNPPDFICRR